MKNREFNPAEQQENPKITRIIEILHELEKAYGDIQVTRAEEAYGDGDEEPRSEQDKAKDLNERDAERLDKEALPLIEALSAEERELLDKKIEEIVRQLRPDAIDQIVKRMGSYDSPE